MIKRNIQTRIEGTLFKGKAVILYGARQVGKTTLIREMEKNTLTIQFISTVMNRIYGQCWPMRLRPL